MDNIDLLKILRKIEMEADIDAWFSHEDTNSWVHVKFAIYSLCLKRNKNLKANSKNAIFHYLRTLRKSVRALTNKKNKGAKNLFFGSSRGLNTYEGSVSDFFFPSNIVSLKDTSLFLNLNDFEEYDRYKDYLDANHVIFDNLFHPLVKTWGYLFPRKKPSKNFEAFVTLLSRHGIVLSASVISSAHAEFVSRYNFFKSLIDRFKSASNAYIVSSYSKSYITAALQHHGISCFEIQHGHIGKTHVGYHYEKIDSLPIPDGMFVYNEFWATEIKRSNFAKDIRIYEKFQYKIVKDTPWAGSNRFFLFTGQGINSDQVNAFINRSAAYLKQNSIRLMYKPHPSENRSIGSIIKESCSKNDMLIFYEGEKSTEQLIAESDAHISISSFCHFDAIHLKGKTYVLGQEGTANIFDDFIDHYQDKFIRINKIEDVC